MNAHGYRIFSEADKFSHLRRHRSSDSRSHHSILRAPEPVRSTATISARCGSRAWWRVHSPAHRSHHRTHRFRSLHRRTCAAGATSVARLGRSAFLRPSDTLRHYDRSRRSSAAPSRESVSRGVVAATSRTTMTPNHALQRTAPCVTAPASAAALPPAMQVPRRTPRSLSLGSLGD